VSRRDCGGTTYLDGNNIMGFAAPSRGAGDRERFLGELLRFKLPRPCCVVFDGPSPSPGGRNEGVVAGVRVLYSAPRKADAVLLERVRPGDLLVTRDRDLGHSAKARGARVMDPDEFLGGLSPRGAGPREKPEGLSDAEMEFWNSVFGGEEPSE
jgi:hypothetical protein